MITLPKISEQEIALIEAVAKMVSPQSYDDSDHFKKVNGRWVVDEAFSEHARRGNDANRELVRGLAVQIIDAVRQHDAAMTAS